MFYGICRGSWLNHFCVYERFAFLIWFWNWIVWIICNFPSRRLSVFTSSFKCFKVVRSLVPIPPLTGRLLTVGPLSKAPDSRVLSDQVIFPSIVRKCKCKYKWIETQDSLLWDGQWWALSNRVGQLKPNALKCVLHKTVLVCRLLQTDRPTDLQTRRFEAQLNPFNLSCFLPWCRWSTVSHKVVSWTGLVSVLRRFMTWCWAAGSENLSSDSTSKTFRKSSTLWARPRPSTWTSWANPPAPSVQPAGRHHPGETKRAPDLHCATVRSPRPGCRGGWWTQVPATPFFYSLDTLE